MKLIAIMTEKSLKLTKDSGFTFQVPLELTKTEIKKQVEETFGVHVVRVRTINVKGIIKKNNRGKFQRIKDTKKAMVFLKTGEKIDLFVEEKKKSKKAK